MRQRSWTSSIVGFALAVLLVAWSLDYLAQVLLAIWPLLAGAASVLAVATGSIALWRRRDYW